MAQIHHGGCLCGAIKYEVRGALRPVIYCHCKQCRKSSGHYVAATSAPRNNVTVTGDVTWFHSSNNARRGFCPACGSNLFWDGSGGNLSIFAGTLDDSNDLTAKGHIFVADKGEYYQITDNLAHAMQDDPDLTTMVPG